MLHPELTMWFASHHNRRGVNRWFWRGVRVSIHKPVRGRPTGIPKDFWDKLDNSVRVRAKKAKVLRDTRRLTNSGDLRAHMVALADPSLDLCLAIRFLTSCGPLCLALRSVIRRSVTRSLFSHPLLLVRSCSRHPRYRCTRRPRSRPNPPSPLLRPGS